MSMTWSNERSGVDAGWALCLHMLRRWAGATHRDCWAAYARISSGL
jgi:hypothetical protein